MDMKEIKIDIPKGYEFAGVDDNAQQVVFTQIQPKYPKTYKKCCEVLELTNLELPTAHGYGSIGIESLQQLLICRDAYWKIAGDWKPNWKSDEHGCNVVKFCIKNFEEEIVRLETSESNTILAFPAKEMRDAFYENFKELIEECRDFI